ncbi:hypothetical protein ABH309_06095 [Chromobacterium piscinae]|uniref:Uncharacterized protein n=1 Tax=Chromobacterium piscinae TaxID=686831 RepID=A0ABV0H2S6_9NEIS
MDNYRNLLALGVNKLLEDNHISLQDPGTDTPSPDRTRHIQTMLAGHPSIIIWDDIGCGELRISVWWKYDHQSHPQANLEGNQRESFLGTQPLARKIHYPKFVGVTVSGWIERRAGKYLQGKKREGLFDIYTRSSEKIALTELERVVPKGYATEGRFHM